MKRLSQMRKGVCAAAKVIDAKFRDEYGDPTFVEDGKRAGEYAPSSPFRVALITLTYKPGIEWAAEHIATLVNLYRQFFARRKLKCHYVWTVELQGNGKPHYHIVMWMPKGVKPPKPDKADWWPHGHTQAIYAISPVGYIAKYASKSEGKSGHHLPKKARLWGYGGLKMVERSGVAYAMAPTWLKAVMHDLDAHPQKRVCIEVKETVQLLRNQFGEIKEDVTRSVCTFGAWVMRSGIMQGWAFISPYSYEGVTGNGMALRHTGLIEVVMPGGGSQFLPHSGR